MPTKGDRAERSLGRAYRLLSDLLAGPITPDLLECATSSPILGAALGGLPVLDDVAAEHHLAFEWSVFPQQGVFVDRAGWADGASCSSLRQELAWLGGSSRDDLPLDHLSNLLEALALTLEAPGDSSAAQGRLLEGHLLRWVPCFAAAVQRLGRPFSTALVLQLEDLLLYHWQILSESHHDVGVFELPGMPSLLEDPDTGLVRIAEFLVSTAQSGLFLSRQDISTVVRKAEVLSSFGDRRGMVLAALRAAVQHDRLPQLVAQLGVLHARWEAQLRERVDAGLPEHLASPWIERSTDTRAMLQVLGAAGQSFATQPEPDEPSPEGLAP